MRILACLASLALTLPFHASPIDDLTAWLARPRDQRPALAEQPFAAAPLTRTQAAQAREKLWADHAAMMKAGHPNDASPLGLRDIGFTIHVGALDDGYKRNQVAAEWARKLDALEKADPDGYRHLVKLHEGRSHWMNREDAEAVDWMLKFT